MLSSCHSKIGLLRPSPNTRLPEKGFRQGRLGKAQSADAVIRKLRDVLNENGLDILADPQLLNLMGVTEINIARMVLGIASPAQEQPYQSMEAIGHDCVFLFNGLLGTSMSSQWLSDCVFLFNAGTSMSSPCVSHAQETAEDPAAFSSGAGERLRELNPNGGRLKGPSILLVDTGFTPGAFCKRKGDKVAIEFQVQSVQGKTVQLKDLKTGGLLKIGAGLAGQWILFKPKAGPECLEIAEIHQGVHGLTTSPARTQTQTQTQSQTQTRTQTRTRSRPRAQA